MRIAGKRLREAFKEEDGFTLSEMLVLTTIMLVVLAALHGVFEASMRVFSFGNDKVESAQNARVALERMEREIRAAFPYDPKSGTPKGDDRLDPANTGASRISFYNDTGGDGKGNGPKETIGFDAEGGSLKHKKGAGRLQPLTALGPGGALEFGYYDENGTEISPPLTDEKEADVVLVRIRLVIVEEGARQEARQELTTDVALRNRGA